MISYWLIFQVKKPLWLLKLELLLNERTDLHKILNLESWDTHLLPKFFFWRSVNARARTMHKCACACFSHLRAVGCTDLHENYFGNQCISHIFKSKISLRSTHSLRRYCTFSNHVGFKTWNSISWIKVNSKSKNFIFLDTFWSKFLAYSGINSNLIKMV